MRIEVTMPRLSDSMTQGTLANWFKAEGDAVAKGEAIAEIETEKSTVDLIAPEGGVLARIVVAAGSGATPVGALLAEIDTEGAGAATQGSTAEPSAMAAAPAAPGVTSAAAPLATPAAPVAALPSSSSRTAAASPSSAADESDEAIPATPLARRMAAQAGLALATLGRSGIGGKVCKADVETALGRGAATAPAAPASRSLAAAPASTASSQAPAVAAPLSRMRRTIAERMARAKATIPHFYLSVDCRVDRLLAVRETLKADGLAVSVNDFVVRASALALRKVPAANASWIEGEAGQGIAMHERVDIAVAVALDDGLVTPVLRAVDTLGLAAIGEQVRELATRAKGAGLAPHEYDGATFTVSNLGMFGIGEMFAIVNPPQACILGVGAAEARPVVDGGQVLAGTVMTLSLSADHRVIDGATGARLLAEIRRLLEEPARMLA